MVVPLVNVFLVLVTLVLQSAVLRGSGPSIAIPNGMQALGRLLFTDYLFPFEVTSVLLLVAIVGVIALAKRKVESE